MYWKTEPYRDGNKLKAEIVGHIIYIKRKTYSSDDINQWYPHSNNDLHNGTISVYFERKWDVTLNDKNEIALTVFPNPANAVVTVDVGTNNPNANLAICCLGPLNNQTRLWKINRNYGREND